MCIHTHIYIYIYIYTHIIIIFIGGCSTHASSKTYLHTNQKCIYITRFAGCRPLRRLSDDLWRSHTEAHPTHLGNFLHTFQPIELFAFQRHLLGPSQRKPLHTQHSWSGWTGQMTESRHRVQSALRAQLASPRVGILEATPGIRAPPHRIPKGRWSLWWNADFARQNQLSRPFLCRDG